MSDDYVLIHYHIFKNAGSSVDASLRHSFGDHWGTFEGPHAHAIQSSEQLSAFIAANKHLVAISSHLARPPLPHSHCLPVVFYGIRCCAPGPSIDTRAPMVRSLIPRWPAS